MSTTPPRDGRPQTDPTDRPGQLYVPVSAALSDRDQRLWATLIHLSPIAAAVIGLPFLGPLIGYLVLKDRGDYVRFHTAQALNLQLTTLIAAIASALLLMAFVGFVLLPAVGIASFVLMIVAAVRASQGRAWRIPLTIPFVR